CSNLELAISQRLQKRIDKFRTCCLCQARERLALPKAKEQRRRRRVAAGLPYWPRPPSPAEPRAILRFANRLAAHGGHRTSLPWRSNLTQRELPRSDRRFRSDPPFAPFVARSSQLPRLKPRCLLQRAVILSFGKKTLENSQRKRHDAHQGDADPCGSRVQFVKHLIEGLVDSKNVEQASEIRTVFR